MNWYSHAGAAALFTAVWPDQPGIALSASFLSHYVLDRLPHWDPGIVSTTTRWKSQEVREFLLTALPDGVFTITFGLLLSYFVPAIPFWLMWGCILAAVLPDIIDGGAKLSNWSVLQAHRKFHDANHFNHYEMDVSLWLSILINLALFAAALAAIFMLLQHRGWLPAH